MKEENREIFVHPEELRIATDEELKKVIEESKQDILAIRSQDEFMVNEKPHRKRALRKLIARCETILRERI